MPEVRNARNAYKFTFSFEHHIAPRCAVQLQRKEKGWRNKSKNTRGTTTTEKQQHTTKHKIQSTGLDGALLLACVFECPTNTAESKTWVMLFAKINLWLIFANKYWPRHRKGTSAHTAPFCRFGVFVCDLDAVVWRDSGVYWLWIAFQSIFKNSRTSAVFHSIRNSLFGYSEQTGTLQTRAHKHDSLVSIYTV